MGGIRKLDDDHYCAWTGGAPKDDKWTLLKDETATAARLMPMMHRPHNQKGEAVTYRERTTGLPTLLKEPKDLLWFEHHVLQHLTRYGLDTVAYVPSPSDPTKMLNIVESHARYTVVVVLQTRSLEQLSFLTLSSL